jgi:hypothetical protein
VRHATLILMMASALGCGASAPPAEPPEQVVERFLAAAMARDKLAAILCVAQGEPRPDGSSTDRRERAVAPLLVATIFEHAKEARLKVVDRELDGARAVVTYEVRGYDGRRRALHRARLEARAGGWKIVLLR